MVPREGFCALSNPVCEFYFEPHGDHHAEEDLDDRLFLISFVKRGSVNQVLETLRPLGQPVSPVWSPIWKFETAEAQLAAEQFLDQLSNEKRMSSLIIRTKDMLHFDDCVSINRDVKKFLSWFEYKGPPLNQAAGGE